MRKTAHTVCCSVFTVSFVLMLIMMMVSISSCAQMYEANIYHASYHGGSQPGWFLALANWAPTAWLLSGIGCLFLGERKRSR